MKLRNCILLFLLVSGLLCGCKHESETMAATAPEDVINEAALFEDRFAARSREITGIYHDIYSAAEKTEPEDRWSTAMLSQSTFDEHGYQESLYREFKEMCRCTLSAILPELDDDAIADLYADLYAQASTNFADNYSPDTGEERPCIEAIYCYESIGLYGYYGAGTANICVIPLTFEDAQGLAARGIELCDLE